MAEEIPQGRYDDLVGKGIPICGMRYVRYLDAEGRSFFRWEWDGEIDVSISIGDLHRVMFSLLVGGNFEEE